MGPMLLISLIEKDILCDHHLASPGKTTVIKIEVPIFIEFIVRAVLLTL